MDLDKYILLTDDHEVYEFLSEGPKGSIRKIVRFQRLSGQLYNLALGDWNENEHKVNDTVRAIMMTETVFWPP